MRHRYLRVGRDGEPSQPGSIPGNDRQARIVEISVERRGEAARLPAVAWDVDRESPARG